MQTETARSSPPLRALLALLVPLLTAITVAFVMVVAARDMPLADPTSRTGVAVFLGSGGVASWLLGMRWYGLRALGMRGGRPLYASIGFATLGWLVFFVARLFLVSSSDDVVFAPNLGQTFLYLLLFEAFAMHIWLFGLFFRSVARWRGPLTAALSSGLLFGVAGFLLFEEAFSEGMSSFLFFLSWGILYGLIRLRTGSFLGLTIVQAMQSLTTWHVLLPEPVDSQLPDLYLVTGILFMILIWRLWPVEEADYRV